jgi:hypothetical protein
MKTSLILILMTLLFISTAMAQTYPTVTIQQIQTVPCGQDSSTMAGDTVVVGGLVTAGTGTLYAGAGVTFFMEDPAGGPFSGIMAYSADAQGYPDLYPGDSIICTAVVSEYNSLPPPEFVTMTELLIQPGTFQFRGYGMPEPEPITVRAAEIDSAAMGDSCAEQYEGVFIKVDSLTVDSLINYTNTSTWICHDNYGDTCYIREASDSIPDSYRPPAGSQFDFVQGVVYHRFGAYFVEPRYARDMRQAGGAPIATAYHTPLYPLVGDVVTITAFAVDDGFIPTDSVRLIYRINLGGWTNVPMTRQSGTDNYTFSLPSPSAGWNVDYYIHVVDNEGNVTNEPYEAPYSFHEYTVQQPRVMTIAEARVDADHNFVPDKLDSAVIITGIAVSPNFSTTLTDFYMQQGSAGIDVFFDSLQILVNPGDSVTVNGIITQYQGKTQIRAYRSNRITLNGPGHLPDTTVVTCHDLSTSLGEYYEGTLIKVSNVIISPIPDPWPTLGYSANMAISVGSDTATLFINSATDIDGQIQMNDTASIVGVLNQYDLYSPYDGYYELMPRFYTDFTWGHTGGVGCQYIVGDANGNGAFNGLDVTYSVAYFKGGPPPPYACECTPGNTWYVAGDVNGSCSFNGLDVTYMVAYFKGGPPPHACADCPPGARGVRDNFETPTPAVIAPTLVPSTNKPISKTSSSGAQ